MQKLFKWHRHCSRPDIGHGQLLIAHGSPTTTTLRRHAQLQPLFKQLDVHGVGYFAEIVVAEEMDCDAISSISERDLVELGVVEEGHRHRILAIIADTVTPTTDACPSQVDHSVSARSPVAAVDTPPVASSR
jgi:hypothetical protein